MASVDDRWFVSRKQADGTVVRERTARHGTGNAGWSAGATRTTSPGRSHSTARQTPTGRPPGSRRNSPAAPTSTPTPARPLPGLRRALASHPVRRPETTYQVGLRLRLHVYPKLGHQALQTITPADIRAWAHDLTMARSYQRTIFANVSQIFAAAVADDVIGKNPCRSRTVRKPVADPHRIVPWSTQRVAGVRDASPTATPILGLLAAGTGLRQGEIFGLSPDDIDFQHGTITRPAARSNSRPGNQAYLALPKGRKIRTVPMPDTVRDALSVYLTRFPSRDRRPCPGISRMGSPSAWRWCSPARAKPVNRHYFNAKIWKPALMPNDVPAIRTTAATPCATTTPASSSTAASRSRPSANDSATPTPASPCGSTPTCCRTTRAAPARSWTPRSPRFRRRRNTSTVVKRADHASSSPQPRLDPGRIADRLRQQPAPSR